MQIVGVILACLVIGIWYGTQELSYSFSSAVKSGIVRVKAIIILLVFSIFWGYVFVYSNFLKGFYESSWGTTSVQVNIILVLSASLALLVFKKISPFNSICYALLGAVWGWQFYQNSLSYQTVLFTGISWILIPCLSAVIALSVYSFVRRWVVKRETHLLLLVTFIRRASVILVFLIGIAIGITNVPFLLAILLPHNLNVDLTLSSLSVSNSDALILAAFFVLLLGIFYPFSRRFLWRKKRLMISSVSIFSSLVALFIVLVLFSIPGLFQFFNVDMIPISPVLVLLGALFGIGFVSYKDKLNIRFFIQSGLTIITTPLLAFSISYVILAYVVLPESTTAIPIPRISTPIENLEIPLTILLLLLIVTMVVASFRRQKLQQQKAQEALSIEQQERNIIQQNLANLELKAIQQESQKMSEKIELRRQELINMALNMNEQRLFLEQLEKEIKKIKRIKDPDSLHQELDKLRETISFHKSFSNEMSGFYSEVETLHKHFLSKLSEKYPELTEQEKRLTTLLRLGFSSKEIANLININPKSVEVSRYRLRKSLGVQRGDNLIQFIKNI